MKLEYSTSGLGGTYVSISGSAPNMGSYNWTVPNVDSSQCVVRVTEVTTGIPTDTSNGTFTIQPVPEITITSPNGGEHWKMRSTQSITWTSTAVSGDVYIHLYKGASLELDIGRATATAGRLSWHLPYGLPVGSDYKIRVFSSSPTVEDYSDASFSILEPATLTEPDFNQDGKPDVLLRNYTHGTNQIWYMNGASKSSSTMLNRIPDVNWHMVGTGDFNSDGRPDILLRHFQTGANQVWYMNNFTKTGNGFLPRIPDVGWKIQAIGDFNSDGKPDLVLRHVARGHNQIWYMDGAAKTGNVLLPRIPDVGWSIEN